MPEEIELSLDELREVAGYAAQCASRVLSIYENVVPGDPRPRQAVDCAFAFAAGEPRTKAIRTAAWGAYKAALEPDTPPAAAAAAHSATAAASAAYLHPLAKSTQVKHILGAAAHAAHAAEIDAGNDGDVGMANLQWAREHTPAAVISVLGKYPAAPGGGGRAGALMRVLDIALRSA
jgi:hypothetical protein